MRTLPRRPDRRLVGLSRPDLPAYALVTPALWGESIPAVWLIPALHGKIEPLMGMRPRFPGEPILGQAPATGVFVGFALLLSVASFGFAFLEAFDISAGAFELDFIDRFGDWSIVVSLVAIGVALGLAILLFRRSQQSAREPADRA